MYILVLNLEYYIVSRYYIVEQGDTAGQILAKNTSDSELCLPPTSDYPYKWPLDLYVKLFSGTVFGLALANNFEAKTHANVLLILLHLAVVLSQPVFLDNYKHKLHRYLAQNGE